MKIVITEPNYFPDNILNELKSSGNDVVAKSMSRSELLDEVEDADVLIIRIQTKVDKELIDRAKKLKFVGSMTTGINHIDTEYAKSKGVKVMNPAGYATTATAEYAMSLIMSMSRKIPWAFADLRSGRWERHEFTGNELSGKTLGVIGFGRIGSRIGKYAEAFGMNVIFFDPYIEQDSVKGSATKVGSVDDILEKSDVITVHAFLSTETDKMIRKEHLAKMKKNAILINTARGKVVDENDLVEALGSGTIAGAALDVFEDEPLPSDNILVKYASQSRNLLLTPHIAGSTNESVNLAAEMVVDKMFEELGIKRI